MPIRYIGREPFFKGKPLYELCRQLRDLGVGRIVYQKSVELKWPAQKSYYRLTKVIPKMSCKEFYEGTAWGEQVFRGQAKGIAQITRGHQADWILVPKEEEEEFCKQTEVFQIDMSKVPKTMECPPLFEMVLKQDLKAKGKTVPDKIKIPFQAEGYLQGLENRW